MISQKLIHSKMFACVPNTYARVQERGGGITVVVKFWALLSQQVRTQWAGGLCSVATLIFYSYIIIFSHNPFHLSHKNYWDGTIYE